MSRSRPTPANENGSHTMRLPILFTDSRSKLFCIDSIPTVIIMFIKPRMKSFTMLLFEHITNENREVCVVFR